ncbi:hypothetical protein D3C72_1988580 [compost metagenome]
MLDQGAGLVTIQTRHQHIDKNNLWMLVDDLGQGIKAVSGSDNFTPHLTEQQLGGSTNRFRVIDHHHLQCRAGLFHNCSTIAAQASPGKAVQATCQAFLAHSGGAFHRPAPRPAAAPSRMRFSLDRQRCERHPDATFHSSYCGIAPPRGTTP